MAGLEQIRSMINDMISPMRNRLMNLISRAVLEAIDKSQDLQRYKLSLFANENRDGLEGFGHYGFTSNPLPGAECVVVFPGGNRDHGLVIAVENREFRLKNLKSGEVALYTDQGDKILFKRGNIIQVHSPNIELGEGVLEKIVNGEAFKTLYNEHTHVGNAGVNTSPPVASMSDSTHLSQTVKAKP